MLDQQKYMGDYCIVYIQQGARAGRRCSSGHRYQLHLCEVSGNPLVRGRAPGSGSTALLWLRVSGPNPMFLGRKASEAHTFCGTRMWAGIGFVP